MQLRNLVEINLESAVASSASYNTASTDISDAERIAFQLNVAANTGTVSVKLQKSLDNSNWKDEIAVTNQDVVTATLNSNVGFFIEKTNPKARYYRLAYTITAGSLTVTSYLLGKGYN